MSGLYPGTCNLWLHIEAAASWMWSELQNVFLREMYTGGLGHIQLPIGILTLSVLAFSKGQPVSGANQFLRDFHTLPLSTFFLSSACSFLVTVSPSAPISAHKHTHKNLQTQKVNRFSPNGPSKQKVSLVHGQAIAMPVQQTSNIMKKTGNGKKP